MVDDVHLEKITFPSILANAEADSTVQGVSIKICVLLTPVSMEDGAQRIIHLLDTHVIVLSHIPG